jgi:hypothetical protein
MKKTISLAALAISASTSSFAIIGPPIDAVTKTYCLATYTKEDGGMVAGTCDQTANNQLSDRQIGMNGCAEGQIALTTSKSVNAEYFPINIRACLPPNVMQL